MNIWVKANHGWMIKDAGKVNRFFNDLGKTYKKIDNKLNVSPTRWLSEKLFGSYQEKMNELREIDAQIRNWCEDLDNCLDRAKDAAKIAKPLDSIFWLSQINTRLKLVSDQKEKITNLTNDEFAEFYGEGDQPIDSDYFNHTTNRLVRAGLVGDLGRKITDYKMNLVYKQRLAKQKKAIEVLIKLGETTVKNTYDILDQMQNQIVSGKIDEYSSSLSKLGVVQSRFESQFKNIYNSQFAGMVDALRKKQEQIVENQKKQEVATGVKDEVEIISDPVIPSLVEPIPPTDPRGLDPIPETVTSPSNIVPVTQPMSQEPPGMVTEEQKQKLLENEDVDMSAPESDKFEVEDIDETPAPLTSRSPELLAKSHEKFIKALKYASILEDTNLMAKLAIEYSSVLEELGEIETSVQLLAVAEGILNEK